MVFWIFALIFAVLVSGAFAFLGYVHSQGAVDAAKALFFAFLGILAIILVLAAQRGGEG